MTSNELAAAMIVGDKIRINGYHARIIGMMPESGTKNIHNWIVKIEYIEANLWTIRKDIFVRTQKVI